jgi:hypothetical protein
MVVLSDTAATIIRVGSISCTTPVCADTGARSGQLTQDCSSFWGTAPVAVVPADNDSAAMPADPCTPNIIPCTSSWFFIGSGLVVHNSFNQLLI